MIWQEKMYRASNIALITVSHVIVLLHFCPTMLLMMTSLLTEMSVEKGFEK